MSDERESQLSAMFDGELRSAECELVARRVARDELLRAQWARYSVIGAALRREEGVALDNRVAVRVRSRLSAESALGNESTVPTARSANSPRWLRPASGLAIAATVAAVSVFALRGRDTVTPAPMVAAVATQDARTEPVSAEPESYVVPAVNESPGFVVPARLATYVVAHSEVSTPLSRRNLLTSLIASEPTADADATGVDGAPIDAYRADVYDSDAVR